jgi:integrase
MPRRPNNVPIYRCHKPTNQAVCTVRLANGKAKVLYLGRWKSAASKIEYGRVVSLVSVNGGIYPSAADDLTVNEALLRYTTHVESYYVEPDRSPSGTVVKIKFVLGYLRRMFGSTPLVDFGPPELKAIRTAMIAEGRARKSINKAAMLVRQFFRWCVEEQIVEPGVLEALRAVRPLTPGRCGAPEGKPREPADPAAVEKTLPFLSPGVRAIVQLLRLSGARPSELVALRPRDLNRDRAVWSYTVPAHKTAWKGKARVIHFGPEAQAVLIPWLDGLDPDEHVFSPRRSEEMRNARRSQERQTPRWPSHLTRNERKRVAQRRRPPSNRYNATAIARAVQRACERAKVTAWTPYQLRHLRAVELREKYGLETVRAVLGQSFMAISDHYSKAADAVLASRAAAETG